MVEGKDDNHYHTDLETNSDKQRAMRQQQDHHRCWETPAGYGISQQAALLPQSSPSVQGAHSTFVAPRTDSLQVPGAVL